MHRTATVSSDACNARPRPPSADFSAAPIRREKPAPHCRRNRAPRTPRAKPSPPSSPASMCIPTSTAAAVLDALLAFLEAHAPLAPNLRRLYIEYLTRAATSSRSPSLALPARITHLELRFSFRPGHAEEMVGGATCRVESAVGYGVDHPRRGGRPQGCGAGVSEHAGARGRNWMVIFVGRKVICRTP
ncbi:hypothetical protein DFH07DRAFT_793698 [Mycena maculata]|uniref:Uncharacterized protein n=1 Tax=Mycena maculata TaxID=230809 RepID=A0AAD7KC99_9AGAR|nr:hypothetical protein DFH07DRAFT_793698 [Mycena maculata]